MIPVHMYAPSAAVQPASASVRRGFLRGWLNTCASIAGFARHIIRKQPEASSAQNETIDRLRHLYRSKALLLNEKEVLCAERAEAVRKHRKVSSFDARLRAVNAELLKVG